MSEIVKVKILERTTGFDIGEVTDIAEDKAYGLIASGNAKVATEKDEKQWFADEFNKKNKPRTEKDKKNIEEAEKVLEKADKRSNADKLVELATENTQVLFTDEHGNPYAAIDFNGHREVHSLNSKYFKQWLSKLFWDKYSKAVGTDAVKSALNVLSSKAIFEGERIKLHLRTAWHEDKIYVDLCNKKWQAVEISKDGWKVVDEYPILFRRRNHMLPITPKRQEIDIDKIFEFIPIKSNENKLLWKAYIHAILIPDISVVNPDIHGSHGSGKSTAFKLNRRLVDPSSLDFLKLPKKEDEMIQALDHHFVAYFDNVSHLQTWQSDVLCRAITGEGNTKRELYSDDEDIIYKFKRRVGLNGINVSAQRSDLLDRTVLFHLDRIPKDKNMPEKKLLGLWRDLVPRLQAKIFDNISEALKIYPEVKVKELPRMADFAVWGEAISRGMGNSSGVFLNAYWNNLKVQNTEALEANPIAVAILHFIEFSETFDGKDEWIGTPKDLLETLNNLVKDTIDIKQKSWPKAPHILTRRLKEVETNLKEEGIEFEFGIKTKEANKIRIKKNTSTSSKAPPLEEKDIEKSGASGSNGATSLPLESDDDSKVEQMNMWEVK